MTEEEGIADSLIAKMMISLGRKMTDECTAHQMYGFPACVKDILIAGLKSHAQALREENLDYRKWAEPMIQHQQEQIEKLEAEVLAARKDVAEKAESLMMTWAHEYDAEGNHEQRNIWALRAQLMRAKLLPKETK